MSSSVNRIAHYLNMEKQRLVDDVDGIEGTVVTVQSEGVEPDNPEIDDVVKVVYIPDIDPFRRPLQGLKMLVMWNVAREMPRKYPADAVEEKTLKGRKPGQPRHVLHVQEDQWGNAPFRERLGEEREAKVQQLQEKVENLQHENDRLQVELTDLQQKLEQDDYTPPGEGRETAEDELSDLEEL